MVLLSRPQCDVTKTTRGYQSSHYCLPSLSPSTSPTTTPPPVTKAHELRCLGVLKCGPPVECRYRPIWPASQQLHSPQRELKQSQPRRQRRCIRKDRTGVVYIFRTCQLDVTFGASSSSSCDKSKIKAPAQKRVNWRLQVVIIIIS